MNSILEYKIIDNNSYIKVVFPITSLTKITSKLDKLEIKTINCNFLT